MLQEITTTLDEKCGNCGDEIAKGSRAYIQHYYDKAYCLSCVSEELGNDKE